MEESRSLAFSDDSPSKKKAGKKVWYPFGSSSHKNLPYSSFCHLSGDAKAFAISLATSSEINYEVLDESELDLKKRDEVRRKFQAKFSSLASSSTLKATNDGPCQEKACQDLIIAINNAKAVFKVDNAKIQAEFEALTIELDSNEAIRADFDGHRKILELEEQELEETLRIYRKDLERIEKNFADSSRERDGFNAQFLQAEYKLQNLQRIHKETNAALQSALWGREDGGKVHKTAQEELLASFVICKPSPETVERSMVASSTAYNALAREDIIDSSERKRDTPVLPDYMERNFMLPSLVSGQSMSFYSQSKTTKKLLKSKKLASSPPETSRDQQLDPVFFRESARLAAYRGSAIGRVREIPEPSLQTSQGKDSLITGRHSEFHGVVLTSKHPGLDFGNKTL